jgi:hypothetical protein
MRTIVVEPCLQKTVSDRRPTIRNTKTYLLWIIGSMTNVAIVVSGSTHKAQKTRLMSAFIQAFASSPLTAPSSAKVTGKGHIRLLHEGALSTYLAGCQHAL